MAGKKRAAEPSSTSAKKAATKGAATAAAKEYLQGDKHKNKKKIGSNSAAADDNKKYHILKLIPIKQEECIALLKKKNVDCGGPQIDSDDKIKRSPFKLMLPLNCKDIDFVYDYDSGDESTNTGKRSKKPDYIRYWSPDDDNENYSVVMKLGRFQMNPHNSKLSRKLCYVGLRNDGEAWISMCQKPSDHLVHVDGKIIEEPKGVQVLSLHNGTVLSLFGQTGFAYRVEIQSSVLANKKHVLSRIDDVLTKYNMCCVCRDPYEVGLDSTSEARLPIKGTCGHAMCEECLDRYFASSLSGKRKLRYINCPECREKSFDVQNKVNDRLLCDLLKARAPKANSEGGNSQVIDKLGTNRSQQQSSEVAMLRKKIEELSKKIEELSKRNEELEKLASENAHLKKRIEEFESNPKEADQKMAESDDSDFRDDEEVDVESLPEQSEHAHGLEMGNKSKVPDTSEEQVDSSAPANKWACTSCTFLNMMRRKKCEVCGQRRK
ncbi:hypothetical protein QTG54_010670 [Skeletonema marinoi]|uniref:RanBP-type and C3HC4-type zinc finger-containing protein 1 n=1 Tax=Skeletonema marinoi TaxID=267567 RepID=A0AAD8Y3V0_9STRA|nr:hypothetical protein QTG54_010670 [Skeletonema marinoi]